MGNRRTAPIPSHWSHVRAVKWARNCKILKVLDTTSDFQEYQNEGLFQVAGKAGAKKEPFPFPTPTASQRRRQSRKAIGNTRRTQVVLCSAAYQAVAHPFALSERQTSQPPAKRQSFLFLRVTSTVKGESAWKRVGQHCAQTGQGKNSTSLQQEINCRNRCISHWLCIVNAPRLRELTSPPASHNLASGRPSHTVPQPFPRTCYITRRSHWDQPNNSRSLHGNLAYHRELHMITRKTTVAKCLPLQLQPENQWPSSEDILQAKANIWTIFWWHSKRKTETFTWNGDTFAELLLNLFWIYLHEL